MPRIKNEVREFAQEIGAEESEEGTEFYFEYRKTFRRSNFHGIQILSDHADAVKSNFEMDS